MAVTPATQAQLSQQLEAVCSALVARDLPGVAAAGARLNWPQLYPETPPLIDFDAPHVGRPASVSFLDHFYMMMLSAGEAGNQELRAFVRQALPLLQSQGYRPLDDPFAVEMITAYPWLARQVAKVTAKAASRTGGGGTILHLAVIAEAPHLATFQNLLVPGVDVNARDGDGRTVLHQLWSDYDMTSGATEVQARGWASVMSLLLTAGADETIQDGGGITPLDLMEKAIAPGVRGLALYGEAILAARQRTISDMQAAVLATVIPEVPAPRLRM